MPPLDHKRPPVSSPQTAAPSPPRPPVTCTRRFSIVGIAALPLVDAVGNEARLWSQEADLYRRRAGESLAGILPKPPPAKPPSSIVSIDAEFASALLAAVRSAAGQDARVVDEVARSLRIQELPFFKEAGTCGHCGTKSGPSALSDRDYFDFEAYIRCKALLDLCPVPAGPPPPAIEGTDEASAPVSAASGPADASRAECLTSLRAEMGDAILHHILDEVDVGGAEAAGIAPTRPILNDALLSASAELDSIRKGVQALLKYFRKKGFVTKSGVSQFGLSGDEFENHMVWARGEIAYLKYWLASPADLRTAAALQSEEGACISFVAAAVEAYLRRCGVEATNLQRVPSLTDGSLVAEQWTLKRTKPLPMNGKLWEKGYQVWKPDACPGGSFEDDCF